MRLTQLKQLWLAPSSLEFLSEKNPLIQELQEMSQILDLCAGMSEVHENVKRDLVGAKREDCGATGLSAEQALRAALVKEKLALSYRELEFHLLDSLSLRSFVRLEPTKRVSKSVLNRDIRLITEETWNLFHECLKSYALGKEIEDGSRVRSDTTGTETNIHHPTDASLICDCVRVLTRLMAKANENLEGLELEYSDHNRRARKRLYKINNAKNEDLRRDQYRDILRVAEQTKSYAEKALRQLEGYTAHDVMSGLLQATLTEEISQYLALTAQVIAQAIRRVLNGEQVPVADKIVSIFEPHTDIIEKGARETLFGHKVCLTSGRSGLILDCMILEGNPADTSLVEAIITRHRESYGSAPTQIAFDGGFASIDNAVVAKRLGVTDVMFSKTKGIDISMLVSSEKVFKVLSHFRAGIEAGISALKRSWGFTRVLAKGWNAFKTSLLNGIVAYNLTLLARLQLQRT